MNYELAKKLKDAGFPQKGHGMWWTGQVWTTNPVYEDGELYQPILSELIEACGDKFVLHSPHSLDVNEEYYEHGGLWIAYKQGLQKTKYPEKGWYGTLEGTGSTPEESVANLYLALHANN